MEFDQKCMHVCFINYENIFINSKQISPTHNFQKSHRQLFLYYDGFIRILYLDNVFFINGQHAIFSADTSDIIAYDIIKQWELPKFD